MAAVVQTTLLEQGQTVPAYLRLSPHAVQQHLCSAPCACPLGVYAFCLVLCHCRPAGNTLGISMQDGQMPAYGEPHE